MGYRILMGYIVGDSWDMMKYHGILISWNIQNDQANGGFPNSWGLPQIMQVMLSIETEGDLAWGSPIKRKPPKKALMDEGKYIALSSYCRTTINCGLTMNWHTHIMLFPRLKTSDWSGAFGAFFGAGVWFSSSLAIRAFSWQETSGDAEAFNRSMAEMEIEFLLWVDIWDGEVHHLFHKM